MKRAAYILFTSDSLPLPTVCRFCEGISLPFATFKRSQPLPLGIFASHNLSPKYLAKMPLPGNFRRNLYCLEMKQKLSVNSVSQTFLRFLKSRGNLSRLLFLLNNISGLNILTKFVLMKTFVYAQAFKSLLQVLCTKR